MKREVLLSVVVGIGALSLAVAAQQGAGQPPAPKVVDSVTIAITERADLLVDFSRFPAGTQIIMRNVNTDFVEDPNVIAPATAAARAMASSCGSPCRTLRRRHHRRCPR